MDAAQLRPLGVGEILDVAIKIYRERFSHMAKAVTAVVAPVSVLSALIQLSLGTSSTGGEELFGPVDASGQTTVDQGEVWAFIAGALIAGLLSYIAAQLATAASFKLVAGAYLDEPPDWRASLAAAVARLGSLMWLTVVLGLAVLAGFVACIIPSIYLYVAFTVAVPALLLDDKRGTKALSRSRQLVKGRWWPVLGVVVVSTILAGIVQAVFSGVLIAIVGSGANEVTTAAASAVAGTISSVLTTPFAAAAIMVLYFDLRVRKEGFDLELLARRVGVEPPPGGWPAGEGGSPGWPPPGAPGEAGSPPGSPPSTGSAPPFWPPPPGWRPDG